MYACVADYKDLISQLGGVWGYIRVYTTRVLGTLLNLASCFYLHIKHETVNRNMYRE